MVSTTSPNKKYVMPHASLGLCVWYASRESTPIPAIITQVGEGSVMLTVFAPDNRAGVPKDGVRHISDPMVRQYPTYEAGTWDYCDGDRQNLEPESRLALAEARLEAIEAAVAELEKQGNEIWDALGQPVKP